MTLTPIRKISLLGLLLASGMAFAKAESLEKEMDSLNLDNQAPTSVSREKLYATQTRTTPLDNRSEFSVGAATDLTGNSFLNTQQVELNYRFHFNSRWSVGAEYAFVGNQFSTAAQRLKQSDGTVPDVPYVSSRKDVTVEANLFYGKIRFSTDSVIYFDQYAALGAGVMTMDNASPFALVGDVGLAVWLGRSISARLGLRDYYYNETYATGSTMQHNLHAHMDIGYLF